MNAPLTGIKILDFTRFQNGPHATVMLSDMGAEIIKIERPGDGDPGRSLGREEDGFCAYFEALDRGKKSMTIDLATEQGAIIIRKLIEEVDVLTENFRPGLLDNLGFGYEDVRKINPQLIYAVNSGFGPEGEWAPRGSFDIVTQGMTGAMLGQAGGPGNTPIQIPWGLADQVGSMIFAYGIMSAIVARERYGVGQKLDTSQMGAMTTLQTLSIQRYLHSNYEPTTRRINPVFYSYADAVGDWLTIGVLTPKHWPLLCEAINRRDLITNEKTADPFARVANSEWLQYQLTESFKKNTRQYWLDELIKLDVPCGPVYSYAEVSAEEQFWLNGYLTNLEHPNFPGHRTVGSPIQLTETPIELQGPAPELGQHTEEILLQLGYTWDQITELRDACII
tara:strand:+ start:1153 stop:2331 length:1179 start_codon:yes stop_codon:yes gene_type:complete